ncbi:MAG: MbnP family protein [Bacteroidota bacterium]|nr:MbnP family protein [Bacteroidota bacterium]
MNLRNYISLLLLLTAFSSCNKKDEPEPESKQKISLHFFHRVDGEAVVFDTMIYENAAANPYLINEIKWFISDLSLIKANGDSLLLNGWKDMHYIDTDLPETHTWKVFDNIPAGDYQEIRFTFGISEEKNQSFMFPNPPERDMFWPEYLGGGYHYMKLNGKWKEPNGNITPLIFTWASVRSIIPILIASPATCTTISVWHCPIRLSLSRQIKQKTSISS